MTKRLRNKSPKESDSLSETATSLDVEDIINLTEKELRKYDNNEKLFIRPEEDDISDLIEEEELVEEEVSSTRMEDNEVGDDYESVFAGYYDQFKNEYIKRIIDQDYSKKEYEDLFDSTYEEILTISENEYKNKVPKDDEWKIGLSDTEIEKYESELKNLRKFIQNDEPTIPQILDLDVENDVKASILTEYDMYKSSEAYSEMYQLYRESLIKKIKRNRKEDLSSSFDDLFGRSDDGKAEERPDHLIEKIKSLNTSQQNKDNLLKLLIDYKRKVTGGDRHSREEEKLMKYYLELPYDNVILIGPKTRKEILPFLCKIKEKLDEELYGLEGVKEELLLYINNKITNPKSNKNNLAFCGPPGVGKTALIKAVANALGLPFEVLPLGGMKDSAPFKGSFQLWEGSSPSLIIEILKRMKTSNGIILLDELDKIDAAEVENALIHLTDQTLNAKSEDLFLSEIQHNFSNLWMMFSMNDERKISKVLKDRLTIINIPKYSSDELFNIIKNHVIPKCGKEIFPRFKVSPFIIEDQVVKIIIDRISKVNSGKSGIRDIERLIRIILYKINLYINTAIYPKNGWIKNIKSSLPPSESISDLTMESLKLPSSKDVAVSQKLSTSLDVAVSPRLSSSSTSLEPPLKKIKLFNLPIIIGENNYKDFIELKEFDVDESFNQMYR